MPLVRAVLSIALVVASASPASAVSNCEAKWSSSRPAPLVGIVTGLEHSGTTIMSWQIKNMPGVWSGFELGFLNATTPADFAGSKFAAMMTSRYARTHLWNISAEGMRRIYDAPCFFDMYERLIEVDGYFRAMPRGVRVLDKSPCYVRDLSAVLRRVPGVPCIVMVKGGVRPSGLVEAIEAGLGSRIMEVGYRVFLQRPQAVMRRVIQFLNLDVSAWRDEFLLNMDGVRLKLEPMLGVNETNSRVRPHIFSSDGGRCNAKLMNKTNGKMCHALPKNNCKGQEMKHPRYGDTCSECLGDRRGDSCPRCIKLGFDCACACPGWNSIAPLRNGPSTPAPQLSPVPRRGERKRRPHRHVSARSQVRTSKV